MPQNRYRKRSTQTRKAQQRLMPNIESIVEVDEYSLILAPQDIKNPVGDLLWLKTVELESVHFLKEVKEKSTSIKDLVDIYPQKRAEFIYSQLETIKFLARNPTNFLGSYPRRRDLLTLANVLENSLNEVYRVLNSNEPARMDLAQLISEDVIALYIVARESGDLTILKNLGESDELTYPELTKKLAESSDAASELKTVFRNVMTQVSSNLPNGINHITVGKMGSSQTITETVENGNSFKDGDTTRFENIFLESYLTSGTLTVRSVQMSEDGNEHHTFRSYSLDKGDLTPVTIEQLKYGLEKEAGYNKHAFFENAWPLTLV